MMKQTLIVSMIGAGLALLAVAAGAFGAHLLKDSLSPEHLEAYQTAVRYQMLHALALLIPVVQRSRWASVCMVMGVLLFSGSLYGLTLLKWSWLGPVTPLGGLLLMLGWGGLMVVMVRDARRGD